MAHPTASVQLIVFGKRNQDDIAGVLKDVATAGFPAIEAGNLFDSLGEEEAQRLLDKNNLRISGAHFGYGDYSDTERLKRHIAYAKAIGCKNLMCSGVSDGKTVAGYRHSARVFNDIGKRLVEAGLQFNYHNHDWEFNDLGGGATGMEILSQETDPIYVKYNMDVFWLFYAGQDPAAFIAKHANRAGYFHFKDGRAKKPDGSRAEFLELGRGDVDLKAAYDAAVKAGATWIVAEQDSTALTPLESVTISRKYLKDVLGV